MISHRRRCIFVHIPKCAGSSIEDAIWPGERSESELWMGFVTPYTNRYQTGGLQHLTATLIREAVGAEIFDSYFKFAVIRNPWDRAASQYAFMRRRPDLRSYAGMLEDDAFERYLELIARREHVQWMPQTAFLYDGAGTLLVDELIRFEALGDGIRGIFERLGIDAELGHAKASSRPPLEELYDTRTRDMVASLYAADIARFGYTFPGG